MLFTTSGTHNHTLSSYFDAVIGRFQSTSFYQIGEKALVLVCGVCETPLTHQVATVAIAKSLKPWKIPRNGTSFSRVRPRCVIVDQASVYNAAAVWSHVPDQLWATCKHSTPFTVEGKVGEITTPSWLEDPDARRSFQVYKRQLSDAADDEALDATLCLQVALRAIDTVLDEDRTTEAEKVIQHLNYLGSCGLPVHSLLCEAVRQELMRTVVLHSVPFAWRFPQFGDDQNILYSNQDIVDGLNELVFSCSTDVQDVKLCQMASRPDSQVLHCRDLPTFVLSIIPDYMKPTGSRTKSSTKPVFMWRDRLCTLASAKDADQLRRRAGLVCRPSCKLQERRVQVQEGGSAKLQLPSHCKFVNLKHIRTHHSSTGHEEVATFLSVSAMRLSVADDVIPSSFVHGSLAKVLQRYDVLKGDIAKWGMELWQRHSPSKLGLLLPAGLVDAVRAATAVPTKPTSRGRTRADTGSPKLGSLAAQQAALQAKGSGRATSNPTGSRRSGSKSKTAWRQLHIGTSQAPPPAQKPQSTSANVWGGGASRAKSASKQPPAVPQQTHERSISPATATASATATATATAAVTGLQQGWGQPTLPAAESTMQYGAGSLEDEETFQQQMDVLIGDDVRNMLAPPKAAQVPTASLPVQAEPVAFDLPFALPGAQPGGSDSQKPATTQAKDERMESTATAQQPPAGPLKAEPAVVREAPQLPSGSGSDTSIVKEAPQPHTGLASDASSAQEHHTLKPESRADVPSAVSDCDCTELWAAVEACSDSAWLRHRCEQVQSVLLPALRQLGSPANGMTQLLSVNHLSVRPFFDARSGTHDAAYSVRFVTGLSPSAPAALRDVLQPSSMGGMQYTVGWVGPAAEDMRHCDKLEVPHLRLVCSAPELQMSAGMQRALGKVAQLRAVANVGSGSHKHGGAFHIPEASGITSESVYVVLPFTIGSLARRMQAGVVSPAAKGDAGSSISPNAAPYPYAPGELEGILHQATHALSLLHDTSVTPVPELHEAGAVHSHGDIHEEHIHITMNGRVLLGGWLGAASLAVPLSAQHVQKCLRPSPEAADGVSGGGSAQAADVWQLGAAMYAAATGGDDIMQAFQEHWGLPVPTNPLPARHYVLKAWRQAPYGPSRLSQLALTCISRRCLASLIALATDLQAETRPSCGRLLKHPGLLSNAAYMSLMQRAKSLKQQSRCTPDASGGMWRPIAEYIGRAYPASYQRFAEFVDLSSDALQQIHALREESEVNLGSALVPEVSPTCSRHEQQTALKDMFVEALPAQARSHALRALLDVPGCDGWIEWQRRSSTRGWLLPAVAEGHAERCRALQAIVLAAKADLDKFEATLN